MPYLLSLQPLLQLQPHGLVGGHHPGSHHVSARVPHGPHPTHPREAATLTHLREHGPKPPLLGLPLHGVPSVAGLHGHGRGSRVALTVERLLIQHHGRVLAREGFYGRLSSLSLEWRGQEDVNLLSLSDLFQLGSFIIVCLKVEQMSPLGSTVSPQVKNTMSHG